ncbi:hypothetical protein LTR12_007113 [Friedmanniomyces endolithicus]|nr:hypothetical protein LTR74_014639 [Friedmanniomyces endolithicus]KAK1818433.1 hypothetical protein LTR12_007113 [Friedmanniomyces endolithicus]
MSTKLALRREVLHRCQVCARLYSSNKGTAQVYYCRECFVEKPVWFCARCRLTYESDGACHHGHTIEARSSAELPSSWSGTNKDSISVDETETPSLSLTSEEPLPSATPKLRMATYEELCAAAAAHGQREVHPASLHHLERAHTLLARAGALTHAEQARFATEDSLRSTSPRAHLLSDSDTYRRMHQSVEQRNAAVPIVLGEAWMNDVIELEYATAVADEWLKPKDCIVREVSADIRQEMNFGVAELELRKAEEWIKEMLAGIARA